MQLHQYIDSITIQIINIHRYQTEIIEFYQTNFLIFIKADVQSINDVHKADIIVSKFNTREVIIYSYCNGTFDNDTTYTTFKFVGIKSYNQRQDKRKMNILNKFVDFLIENDIEYRLTTIDISYDFHTKKSIKNFFPIRVNKQGLKSEVNNPFNYCENTTLYLENKDIKKPSLKAYIYDKPVKNNLKEPIIRFEISIRNIKSKHSDYQLILNHINQQLSKYKLFYFDIIANCNEAKRLYKKSYKVSRKLEKLIDKLNGTQIELMLSSEIVEFISKLYCKQEIENILSRYHSII